VAEAKKKILVIENDPNLAAMLIAYFRVQGYEIYAVYWGEDGVGECQTLRPDIVILEIHLPDIDGYEVARRLRSNRRTAEIPIIFLIDKADESERLQGLRLGADDTVMKPFDVQELRLRIRNTLLRAGRGSRKNPITGLPDGRLVGEFINACLQTHSWGMLVISLENIDNFRETYGFLASDDVLRAVSLMVQNAAKEAGDQDDFLGHLGPAEFILIAGEDKAMILAEQIRSRLKQSLDYFYPIKDREKTPMNTERIGVKVGVLKAGDTRPASSDEVLLALQKKKN
jgi:DNA-binding response OmpR family regulator